MLNFTNKEDMMNYFANNSKHYTPHSIIEIINSELKDIDFTGMNILETSVGEGHLLAGIVEANPTMKYANIYIHDIEDFNLEMTEARLKILGCENVQSFLGDFMLHEYDNDFFDYCFQNPPYGSKVEVGLNDTWKGYLKKKTDTLKTPELAFVGKAVDHSTKTFTVLPLGALFRGGWEKIVREYITGSTSHIIKLPDNLFSETTIQVLIMINEKDKDEDTTRFVDVSSLKYWQNGGNIMNENHIKETIELINGDEKTEKGATATKEEIKSFDYNFDPKFYLKRVKDKDLDFTKISKEFKETVADSNETGNEIIKILEELEGIK